MKAGAYLFAQRLVLDAELVDAGAHRLVGAAQRLQFELEGGHLGRHLVVALRQLGALLAQQPVAVRQRVQRLQLAQQVCVLGRRQRRRGPALAFVVQRLLLARTEPFDILKSTITSTMKKRPSKRNVRVLRRSLAVVGDGSGQYDNSVVKPCGT